MSTLKRAYQLAVKYHEGQVDKLGKPYVEHPIRVMKQCGNEDEKIVALLHDIVEDTPVTFADLRQEGFDKHIIKAIDCITHREGESYHEYLNRVKSNPIATWVKRYDLQDNMDLDRLPNITDKDLSRLEKYLYAYNELEGCWDLGHCDIDENDPPYEGDFYYKRLALEKLLKEKGRLK